AGAARSTPAARRRRDAGRWPTARGRARRRPHTVTMAIELTLDEVKRASKREAFRAGVQMRLLMPRLSVHVTRWIVARTRLVPNTTPLTSWGIGRAAALAFAATNPLLVTAGLLAYHVHVLLDYVDGEVARCRKATSVRGAYLDLITDRITFPLL